MKPREFFSFMSVFKLLLHFINKMKKTSSYHQLSITCRKKNLRERKSNQKFVLWLYFKSSYCQKNVFGSYIYARVEEGLYYRLFIGRYKSVAYQAVSITLPEECSSGFVHWFPVWWFLQPRIFVWVPLCAC